MIEYVDEMVLHQFILVNSLNYFLIQEAITFKLTMELIYIHINNYEFYSNWLFNQIGNDIISSEHSTVFLVVISSLYGITKISLIEDVPFDKIIQSMFVVSQLGRLLCLSL